MTRQTPSYECMFPFIFNTLFTSYSINHMSLFTLHRFPIKLIFYRRPRTLFNWEYLATLVLFINDISTFLVVKALSSPTLWVYSQRQYSEHAPAPHTNYIVPLSFAITIASDLDITIALKKVLNLFLHSPSHLLSYA